MTYNHWRRQKYDYDHRPNFGKSCGYNYDHDYQSSYLDDYTISAISYEESIKKPRLTSPHSKSEYGQQRHSRQKSIRRKSPTVDYDNFSMQDDSIKKRSKETRNNIQDIFYQFEIDNNKFKKPERRSRSPRKSYEYEDHLFEGQKDNNHDYNNYFEKSKLREKKIKNYVNEDIAGEGRMKSDKRKQYSRKDNDYQVFAYNEPELHKKVFRLKGKSHEISSPSSEVEIKNTDYPILAFRDNIISQGTSKTSSVFYLPTVYCKDKKSKSRGKTKPRTQSSPPVDTQVFAANIKEEKNIFTQEENNRNKHNSANRENPELQTEESLLSRDTKLKGDSNARTSTETQTEESLIFDHRFPVTSNYKNAGSSFGRPTILEMTDLKIKTKGDNSLRESIAKPKIKNNNSFAYQIDIDIEPVKKNVFGSKVSKKEPNTKACPIEYKQIEDPLYDNYPVTKDYIKVSDNTPSSHTSEALTEIKSKSKCVVRDNHSALKKNRSSKDINANEGSFGTSRMNEIVYKNPPESIFNRNFFEYNHENENHRKSTFKPTMYEFYDTTNNSRKMVPSHNAQVFRSTVNNSLKKSITQRSSIAPQEKLSTRASSPKQLTQIDDEISVISLKSNRQSKVLNEPETQKQMLKGRQNEEEGPDNNTLKKMSMTKQRYSSAIADKRESRIESGYNDSLSPVRKSQSIIGESKVETPNADPPLTARKSQSVIRESRVGRQNTDTLTANRKKQSVIRDSSRSMVTPNTDSLLVDRKSQLFSKESRMDRPFSDSSLVDIKRQSVVKESKVKSPSYIADKNEDTMKNKPKSSKLYNSALTTKLDNVQESKSILRVATPSKKISRSFEKAVKPDDSENVFLQEEILSDTDNLKVKEEIRSLPRSSNEYNSQDPEIKNKSRLESKKEVEIPRKSLRQSSVAKSGQTTGEERKSRTSKSKLKDMTSKRTFSKLFSRSKSKVGKENDEEENQIQSKGPSKTKSPPTEENEALAKDSASSNLKQTSSQATLNQRNITKTQSTSSKSHENVPSQANKPKSTSKVRSFFTRSKSNKEQESNSHVEPAPQPTESYREIPSEASVKKEEEQKSLDGYKKENVAEKGKPCECIVQYVKQARECGNFFLGTTLHEQIMDILKVI